MKRLPVKSLLITVLALAGVLTLGVLAYMGRQNSTPEPVVQADETANTANNEAPTPKPREAARQSGSANSHTTDASGTGPSQSVPAAAGSSVLGKSSTGKSAGPEFPALGQKLIDNATLLERTESISPKNGLPRTLSLYRAKTKYPMILLEEQTVPDGRGGQAVSRDFKVADHVLVRMPDDVDETMAANFLRQAGLEYRSKLETENVYLVTDPDAEVDTTLVERLAKAVPKEIAVTVETDNMYFSSVLPNDPDFNNLYGLNNTGQTGGIGDADIDAPEAWDISQGSSDVIVGIIDTGVDYDHPDLAANIWVNPGEIPGNGIDDDNNGFVDDVYGYDFYDRDADPDDPSFSGHGTHVAGTTGARGNNLVGVTGATWEVRMMALRFLGPFGGFTSDAIDCVNYATDNGAGITNNSWGGGGFSALLKNAIENGGNNGVLFCAAAGNSGVNIDTIPHYPASYDSEAIISVAASDDEDRAASFTNYGSTGVDLAAPGVAIFSTYTGGTYANLSGTSMACPHVAGSAALLRAIVPALPVDDLKEVLMDTVDSRSAFAGITVTGGRLNLHEAAKEASRLSLILLARNLREDGTGNNDGIFNPGETLLLDVRLFNNSDESIDPNQVELQRAEDNDNIVITPAAGFDPDPIAPGQTRDVTAAFSIALDGGVTTPYPETLKLVTSYNDPAISLEREVDVEISTTSIVTGTVTDDDDGSPVGGARVVATRQSDNRIDQTQTEADGTYELKVPDGEFEVYVTAGAYRDSDPQTITVPPDISGVNFALVPREFGAERNTIVLEALVREQVTLPLSLFNKGSDPVEWQLDTITDITGQDLGDDDRIVMRPHDIDNGSPMSLRDIEIGVYIKYAGHDYSDFLNALRARGANVTELRNAYFETIDNETTYLDPFDLVIIDDSIAYWFDKVEAINALRQYLTIHGGSCLMMADDGGNYRKVGSILEGTGILNDYRRPQRNESLDQMGTHYCTAGVGEVDMMRAGHEFWIDPLSFTGTPLIHYEDNTMLCGVATLMGSADGRMVALGAELADDENQGSDNNKRLIHQIVDWLTLETNWVSASPGSGTIEPGGTMDLNITGAARDLDPGTYLAELYLSSNHPIDDSLTVLVQFIVSGYPEASRDKDVLDFGTVQTGSSTIQHLKVTNTGGSNLDITSITFEDALAPFSLNTVAPLTVAPGDDQLITFQFDPTVDGSIDSDVVIETNGEDKNFKIRCLGTAASSLAFEVSPTSLAAGLNPGDSVDQDLTVSTTGIDSVSWTAGILNSTATWLSLAPTSGLSNPGTPQDVTATFAAADDMSDGVTSTRIQITSTTGEVIQIPVELTVTSTGVLAFPTGQYEAWRANGIGAGPLTGIFEDFDGDGVINGWEFLRGSNASIPDAGAPLLRINGADGSPELSYQKSSNVSAGVFQLYASDDFVNWNRLVPGKDFEQAVTAAETGDQDIVTLRVTAPDTENTIQADTTESPDQQFFRLEFEL